MKPYMIIEGSNNALENFEKKVADALDMGYSLGEMATHAAANNELKFYQTMIMDEDGDEDEDEEDFEDDEDE